MPRKHVLFLRVSEEAAAWVDKKFKIHKGKIPANILIERLILADKKKIKATQEYRRAKTV